MTRRLSSGSAPQLVLVAAGISEVQSAHRPGTLGPRTGRSQGGRGWVTGGVPGWFPARERVARRALFAKRAHHRPHAAMSDGTRTRRGGGGSWTRSQLQSAALLGSGGRPGKENDVRTSHDVQGTGRRCDPCHARPGGPGGPRSPREQRRLPPGQPRPGENAFPHALGEPRGARRECGAYREASGRALSRRRRIGATGARRIRSRSRAAMGSRAFRLACCGPSSRRRPESSRRLEVLSNSRSPNRRRVRTRLVRGCCRRDGTHGSAPSNDSCARSTLALSIVRSLAYEVASVVAGARSLILSL